MFYEYIMLSIETFQLLSVAGKIPFFSRNIFRKKFLGARCNILWLGEFRLSSSSFVNLSCACRPCFSSKDSFYFYFISIIVFIIIFWLPFFPSASWPQSFLSLFFLFLRPCLIHARMPEGVGLFCMDSLSCIHGVGR